jgi:NADH dehydrogenase
MASQRILIVGGGFAGTYAALQMEPLAAAGHRVTLVSTENFMQYQPFLPEVASGTIDPRAIVVPLRPLLRHAAIVVGEVIAIEHAARRVRVRIPGAGTVELDYDVIVLAAGSWSRVLPIPGLAELGVGFKTVQEAIWLRNHVLSRLDLASETQDPARRRSALTFVFVGAGYAGVEALGELEDLARDALGSYPMLSRADMRWVMVEAAERILPELPPDLADYARQQLVHRGIEILTSTRLESASDGTIALSDGQAFPADTLVWTAGVKPSPLAVASGFPLDERGRVVVDDYLRVVGVPGAWAAGDIAAVPDRTTGGQAPPTAQHALREGRRLGRNVVASVLGGALEPFAWRNVGGVCSLGRYQGVADVQGIKVRGFLGWLLHRSYHLWAMPTIGRRVRIAIDWTIALLFPRDIAQLGALERPREPFERAARGGRERPRARGASRDGRGAEG